MAAKLLSVMIDVDCSLQATSLCPVAVVAGVLGIDPRSSGDPDRVKSFFWLLQGFRNFELRNPCTTSKKNQAQTDRETPPKHHNLRGVLLGLSFDFLQNVGVIQLSVREFVRMELFDGQRCGYNQ